ncbi:MAG: indole-3-glycerol phosphate synthase TrpC [Candidatus Omnitrophica bacterium]|nr:indole-3-glycerol phosphate synthase TrpC [Candidatus Omnitrophota bacterium]
MNILEKILEEKRKIVEKKKKEISIEKLNNRISENFRKYSIYNRLKESFGIICEIKRTSPSSGIINENIDFRKIAEIYEKSGVSGISVLTCEPYFAGSINDLKDVKEKVKIPVLMKDFVIDEYQIYEGNFYGADFILLIVRILDDERLKKFISICKNLNLEILVEVFDVYDLKRIFNIIEDWENKILGINNRDLTTLKTDINNTLNLIKYIPTDKIIVISESGIKSRNDVEILKNEGVKGVLVGEAILRSKNIEEKIKEFIN